MGTKAWPMIRAERASLADALAALPDGDWDKPSLVTGWRVREVVGHLISTASMNPLKFLVGMASTGFRFHALTAKGVRKATEGRSNRELVEAFTARVDARSAPPGPAVSWLGETIVHGEDIFRALGGYRDHPTAHVIAVADFYTNGNLLIGGKRRITGLTLEATDADWRHGTGPTVRGPAVALVMAMTGRKAALDDLAGEGVATLRQRP